MFSLIASDPYIIIVTNSHTILSVYTNMFSLPYALELSSRN